MNHLEDHLGFNWIICLMNNLIAPSDLLTLTFSSFARAHSLPHPC